MGLFKCIRRLTSEDLLEVNVLRSLKNPWNLQKSTFIYFFSAFRSKLSEQKLFLIRSKILGLLLNTLTVNYDLSRSNRDNLPLPIGIKLPKKRKSFCRFSLSFWYLHEISNVLKKNEPHRSIISGVIDSERWAYLNA